MDRDSRELMCLVVMTVNVAGMLGLLYNAKRMNRLSKFYDAEATPLLQRKKLLLPMLAETAGILTLLIMNIGVTVAAIMYRQ